MAIQNRYRESVISMIFATLLWTVAGLILLNERPNPPQQCIASQGATVQWRGYENVVRENIPVVFLTLRSGGYCKVASRELYQHGVGYTTDRIYTGVLYGANQ
jgi:hypothetical protein